MIIDSGWDFLSIAQLRWADSVGTGRRQFVVLGDHHWWFDGVHDLHHDRQFEREEWVNEVLRHADIDYVRYTAVVVETADSTLDYSLDAYPFDRLLRDRAKQCGIHHMGTYFVDPGRWSGTGPMKTFSTYVGAENCPTNESRCALAYPEPRRAPEQLALEERDSADRPWIGSAHA
ncbi:hypothetical protein ACLBXX_01870 [Microbacterium sp. C23T]